MRIGHGYDVHRLVPGRPMMLGGVEIPGELGTLGHSDGDAALHALMDAMLGACALRDIGTHFPDSDDRYKGISSMVLLCETAAICQRAGFALSNADITIVAQQPKLSPFIPKMRQNIADTLHVSADCISVKATTTERMGFEGRGEGISASAVVTMTAV